MLYEINIKPRKVIIQTRTFKGKWIDAMTIVSDAPLEPFKLWRILETADNYGYGARALSSRNNQLMCTRATWQFYDWLQVANLVSFRMQEDKECIAFVCSHNNDKFPSYEELEKIFIKEQGIDRVKFWKTTAHDGELNCCEITFNSGKKATLAFYD